MIRLRGRRVFARASPTDMRKGFSGLSALVIRELGHDLVEGDVFVFMSRRRTTVKVLVWDGTGLSILQKRLAQGRFAPLWGRVEGGAARLSHRELTELLSGSDVQLTLGGRRRRAKV
jgi:transposase